MWQIEVSFICSIWFFSDRETLNLLAVLKAWSFEGLLPRLTFTCFCFICWTVPVVFTCDYRKCHKIPESYFLSSGWMSLCLFPCGAATHILQFFSGIVSLNFGWLWHNDFSLTINLVVSFYFIYCSYFVWTATLFCLFFWVKLPHFSLSECHTNILCVSIISVWMSHMRVSIFFVWMPHKYPCVSLLLLIGHSTLLPFRS